MDEYAGLETEKESTEKDADDGTDEELLKEARDRLKMCIDACAEERIKQRDDLHFSTLEQWPDEIRNERENDINGPRPCLTIDKINQYITQVVNDMRQHRPSIKPRPVDDDADVQTAKVFAGVIRHIEESSNGGIAYGTAGESAVRIGEGFFRFVTEYEDSSFNQTIKFKHVPNAFSVYLGPHHLPDGSDAEYGFVIEDVPKERFKREYPKAKSEVEDFAGIDTDWASEDSIRVAEYFYFEFEDVDLLYLADGRTVKKDEYDDLPVKSKILKTRVSQEKETKWCKMTGAEVLEREDWAGKYIPIVKVVGKEAWVDGKRRVWGLVRPAKDSLRMYNYWASTITEKLALSPKTPFIGAVGQFATQSDKWDKANRVSYSRLEYDPVSVDGQVAPPPRRVEPAALEVAMIKQLEIIEHDIQTSLGMYKASLGQEQPQQSGKAILALTRESDTGTFHFQDNLAISITHAGRILIDLIPKVMDTAEIARILGEDGQTENVKLDPNQAESVRKVQQMDGSIKSIYNLNVGTYDVVVTSGPSYNTKRMESAEVFTDLANSAKDPISASVMRYLAVKNSDFNGSDEAVEMLKKLLPPQVQTNEGQPQIPPQVMAQMDQMKQTIQMLGQENQELKSGVQEAQAKIQVSAQEGKAKHDARIQEIRAEFSLKREANAEEMQFQREKVHAELQLEQEKTTMLANLERWKAELEARTELEIAGIEASVDIKIANLVDNSVDNETKETA